MKLVMTMSKDEIFIRFAHSNCGSETSFLLCSAPQFSDGSDIFGTEVLFSKTNTEINKSNFKHKHS